jgi:SAM-dependent methyltransferase
MQERSTSDAATAARFGEDLPTMAAQAYALADRYCSHCRNFHALWPYRRLARMCGAAESGADEIERTLTRLIAAGGKRILIAAAADTGLLATVARAGAGLDPEITVVDRCETPLELCRRYASECGLPVDTRIVDLNALDLAGFDVVYANSVLQFIPVDLRVNMLTRVRRSLRPGGHFVCVFNAGGRFAGEVLPEYRGRYADWLLAELDRLGVPLPDSLEMFRQRTNDYTRELETREGEFSNPQLVDSMMEAAGFAVLRRDQIAMPLAAPFQNLVGRLSKARFLTVARSPLP